MKDNYKLLIKDTFIFALGSLGSKLILFFLVPLYTNYLTTSEYGKAELVNSFSFLVIPFSALVINEAVIRFGMKKDEKKENVLLSAFIVLLTSTVASFLICYALHFYEPLAKWWPYLYLYVILSNISEVGRSYLKVKNQNKKFAIISILQTMILALSNIMLLTILKTGIKGYLTSTIIAVGFSAVLSFFIAGIPSDLRNSHFEPILLKKMIYYSSPLIFSNISWWVIHSSDKIMIERMMDESSLGIYTAATKIPALINVIIAIFNQAWGLSSIREIESSNDQHFYSDVFNKFILILFGAAIFLTSIIKPFMSIYVGNEFEESWRYVPLLLSSAVFFSISAFIGSLYAALQKNINNMWTTILCAMLNVIINYLCIPHFGVWGAVIGTVSSYFFISVIRVINIKRLIVFDISNTKFIINTSLMVVYAIVVSIGKYIPAVSCVTIIAFLVVNYSTLLQLANSALGILKTKKK